MSHSRVTRTLAIAVVALAESLSPSSFAQNAPASVEEGFKNPPSSAQPRVWWHWMNGNITKEGIKLDLEWMNRVGIGGFQNFDASLTTPKLVDKRLVYMTPEWKDAFRYATTLADVLALDPNTYQMSLPVLKKIRDLVQAGAVVRGLKPTITPSLSDDPKEFQRIADELWGSGAGNAGGKGRVYGDKSLGEVLTAIGVAPDFHYTRGTPDTHLLFVHRKLADGELYYVDNSTDHDEGFDASFRVTGKEAELWHADTGTTEPASFQIADSRTTVPLHLEPWGTVFVVFRKPARTTSRSLPKMVETTLATVEGPWDLSFEPNLGAPTKIALDQLISWSDSSDEGVKYFSGKGTYTKTIDAPADWSAKGAHVWLDLGDVKNLAEVSLNATPLGIVWKTPYRVDITRVLKPGRNVLEIRVTNAWVNRIIGDRQPNVTKTYTFTSPKFYKADSKLVASGLLGPVKVIRITRE